ncbi:MAG: hypothetical protein WC322_02755 [Candidatus Paceibacterota bacterium]|jgi:hypothetical protein
MTQDQRDEIDRLVNIFINGLTSISKDAGWEGDSLLSRVIEFAGCPPRPTGYDQSNMAMINAIRFLFGSNPDLPRIKAAINLLLKSNQAQIEAILHKHFYRGLNERTDRSFTDADRARLCNQDERAFRYNVTSAYKLIDRELDRVDLVFAEFYEMTG